MKYNIPFLAFLITLFTLFESCNKNEERIIPGIIYFSNDQLNDLPEARLIGNNVVFDEIVGANRYLTQININTNQLSRKLFNYLNNNSLVYHTNNNYYYGINNAKIGPNQYRISILKFDENASFIDSTSFIENEFKYSPSYRFDASLDGSTLCLYGYSLGVYGKVKIICMNQSFVPLWKDSIKNSTGNVTRSRASKNCFSFIQGQSNGDSIFINSFDFQGNRTHAANRVISTINADLTDVIFDGNRHFKTVQIVTNYNAKNRKLIFNTFDESNWARAFDQQVLSDDQFNEDWLNEFNKSNLEEKDGKYYMIIKNKLFAFNDSAKVIGKPHSVAAINKKSSLLTNNVNLVFGISQNYGLQIISANVGFVALISAVSGGWYILHFDEQGNTLNLPFLK